MLLNTKPTKQLNIVIGLVKHVFTFIVVHPCRHPCQHQCVSCHEPECVCSLVEKCLLWRVWHWREITNIFRSGPASCHTVNYCYQAVRWCRKTNKVLDLTFTQYVILVPNVAYAYSGMQIWESLSAIL